MRAKEYLETFVTQFKSMNIKQVVKYSLLRYPTLFECRIDVLIHLFAVIGNGFEWHEGEMVDVGRDKGTDPLKMKYDDVHEDIKRHTKDLRKYQKMEGHEGMVQLVKSYLVSLDFEKTRRKFVEKNIEMMSSSSHLLLKSEYKVHLGHYMTHPCYRYAKIFHVPEDIKEDWGDAAQEFAGFWIQRIYAKHHGFFLRPGKDGKDRPIRKASECYNDECRRDWNLCRILRKQIDKIDIALRRKTHTQRNKEMAKDVEKFMKRRSKKS